MCVKRFLTQLLWSFDLKSYESEVVAVPISSFNHYYVYSLLKYQGHSLRQPMCPVGVADLTHYYLSLSLVDFFPQRRCS